MSDQPMRDMIPPDGELRSVRKIQINKEDSRSSTEESPEVNYSSEEPLVRRDEILNKRERSYKGWGILIGAILLIFIFISLTPILSKADVEIIPKNQIVEISGEFNASSDRAEADGDVVYQTATFEEIGERRVEAFGEENVSRKASGKITIYNEFDEDPQRLIANTRFETSNGLIYRIEGPVTVPGVSRTGGSVRPGSIEVTVYADEPGERYNITSAEFTVPGLVGDPRFEKIYAKTATGISGGFEGVTKIARSEDVLSARENIREELAVKIEEKVRQNTPFEFIILEKTISVRFEQLPESSSNSDDVIVRERAVATVMIFKKDELASFVAKQTLGSYNNEPVRIDDLKEIELEAVGVDTDSGALNFTLSGSPKIVWSIDYDSLKKSLLGKSKKDALKTFANNGSIQEAKIKIRPFWKRTIPSNEKKVNLIEIIR